MNQAQGSFFMAPVAKVWMKQLNTGVFTTRSVNELLWGYADPLLLKASTFKKLETDFGFMLNVSIFFLFLLEKYVLHVDFAQAYLIWFKKSVENCDA